MNGLQETRTKLLVIGGGITGLAAAYLAAKAGHAVTLLEAGERLGGLLRTFSVGGTRLECFYHHFFTHDLELHWLLQELNLADEARYRATTMGMYRNRTIFDFNGARDLLAFHPIPLHDRVRFGLSSLVMGKCLSWRSREGTAAIDWFYRFAGKQATDAIWAPLLKVKFGPYYDRVSAAWMIGRLRQRMNSRKGTDETLGYLRGSSEVLCRALSARLSAMGAVMHTNMPVTKLEIDGNTLTAVYSGNRKFESNRFLFTIPTTALQPLVKSFDAGFAAGLQEIEYCGAVCVVLVSKQPLSHIYWLNVADPGFPFGGVIEHTNFIDPGNYQNRHIVYLSRYYAASEEIAGQDDETVIGIMLQSLRRLRPSFREATLEDVFIFRTPTAATVCPVNFSKKIPACKTPIGNMYIAGMPHIYPDERSCNNAIRVAAQACRVMELNCPSIPRGPSLAGQVAME
jgi:protoporphyrinogen oxidase